MDDLFKSLLEFRNSINLNGLIVLPQTISGNLVITVEWGLDKTYRFSMDYNPMWLDSSNISLARLFIDEANSYIDSIIS